MKINCCWLYAISRYGYPPSLKDTFRALREMRQMGFEAGELEGVHEPNLRAVYASRRDLRSMCRDAGLKIMNFCPILPDIVSMDGRKRRRAAELFGIGAELANYFGSKLIQIDSFTPPLKFKGLAPYKKSVRFNERYVVRVPGAFSWGRQWGALVDGISRCLRIARRNRLTLLLEPRVGEMISNTDAMLRLMGEIGTDGFGAVLDTGHQYAQKELLPLSVMKLGASIKYVHASDNDGLANEHRAVGDGSIDWDGLANALKRVGFNGYVGVDVGRVPRLMDACRRSRRRLLSLARRHGL